MNINWTVRMRNRQFWIAMIPAIALLVQAVAAVFGFALDLTTLVGRLLAVVEAAFVVLTIIGVVVDPTTVGISDSGRALGYTEPHDDIAGLR